MTNGRNYSAHPPRAASWLLDLFVPGDQITPILGDLLEEFSAEAVRMGVSSARRWYWRQSAKSILHFLDAQLRLAPWRSLASVLAGLLLLWVANMPLVGIPRLVSSGDWPEPLRLAWLAFVPTLPIVDLIFPPMLIAWAIARMNDRREMAVTALLGVLIAAVRLISLLIYGPSAEIPPTWSPFWLADPIGVVVCPVAMFLGALIARRTPLPRLRGQSE
jgi:hypothetical protein